MLPFYSYTLIWQLWLPVTDEEKTFMIIVIDSEYWYVSVSVKLYFIFSILFLNENKVLNKQHRK